MATVTSYAIGTLTLALLLSLGIQFTPEKTYYCESRDMVLECSKLSSTGTRCYYDTGYRDCTGGWKHIEQFIPKTDTSVKVKVNANGGNYECSTSNGEVSSYTKCLKSDGKQAYLGELV